MRDVIVDKSIGFGGVEHSERVPKQYFDVYRPIEHTIEEYVGVDDPELAFHDVVGSRIGYHCPQHTLVVDAMKRCFNRSRVRRGQPVPMPYRFWGNVAGPFRRQRGVVEQGATDGDTALSIEKAFVKRPAQFSGKDKQFHLTAS